MTNLLRLSDLQWPCTRADLERDNPNTWFPPNLADCQPLDTFGYALPAPTEPPSQDGHQAVEAMPECVDGQWRQAWELQPLPPAPPRPNWAGFAVSLIFDADIQQWFNNLPQGLASGLNAGLQLASEGRPDLFLKLWERLAAQIPAEVVAAVVALAQECNLPAEFVAVLNGASGS